MASTGYPGPSEAGQGMVEETAPAPTAQAFAIARLDTDWFPSAQISMEVFWPLLSRGGVLVVDDLRPLQGPETSGRRLFCPSWRRREASTAWIIPAARP